LREITLRQQREQLCRPVADRNGIGGDILLWNLEADPQGRVTSSVRPIHRFETYEADMSIIEGMAA
jgi:hypothetical protein